MTLVFKGATDWTPTFSGPQCVIVHLTDPEGIYAPQQSQRNVDVVDRPFCGTTRVYTLTIQNPTASTVTVDIGLITFNVPSDWVITTVPTGSVEIGPNGQIVVEVHVTIPCPTSIQDELNRQKINALQAESGGAPIIDVEGYIEGELVGGIELQFEPEPGYHLYLPRITKNLSGN